jgi:hypothetical protein
MAEIHEETIPADERYYAPRLHSALRACRYTVSLPSDINHCGHCCVHHAAARACGAPDCVGCYPWPDSDPRNPPTSEKPAELGQCDLCGVPWAARHLTTIYGPENPRFGRRPR